MARRVIDLPNNVWTLISQQPAIVTIIKASTVAGARLLFNDASKTDATADVISRYHEGLQLLQPEPRPTYAKPVVNPITEPLSGFKLLVEDG